MTCCPGRCGESGAPRDTGHNRRRGNTRRPPPRASPLLCVGEPKPAQIGTERSGSSPGPPARIRRVRAERSLEAHIARRWRRDVFGDLSGGRVAATNDARSPGIGQRVPRFDAYSDPHPRELRAHLDQCLPAEPPYINHPGETGRIKRTYVRTPPTCCPSSPGAFRRPRRTSASRASSTRSGAPARE